MKLSLPILLIVGCVIGFLAAPEGHGYEWLGGAAVIIGIMLLLRAFGAPGGHSDRRWGSVFSAFGFLTVGAALLGSAFLGSLVTALLPVALVLWGLGYMLHRWNRPEFGKGGRRG